MKHFFLSFALAMGCGVDTPRLSFEVRTQSALSAPIGSYSVVFYRDVGSNPCADLEALQSAIVDHAPVIVSATDPSLALNDLVLSPKVAVVVDAFSSSDATGTPIASGCAGPFVVQRNKTVTVDVQLTAIL